VAYGCFKKIVVANRLNEYVAVVFATPPDLGTEPFWLAAAFNALCLYADFSGYVDIAIGSARLFGIRLDPNFDRPFTSTSVTELWRRWHMSLSFWLRDYLYLPLVFRIRDLGRTGVVVALVFTFAVCGIWHGLTWNYLLFGVSQGLAMSVEFLTKSWRSKRLKSAPKRLVSLAGSLYLLSFFVLSEVLFRSTTLHQACAIYRCLFHLRLSGLFGSVDAVRMYQVALDLAAVGFWAGMARLAPKMTARSTPWFVLLCGLLIVFLGHLSTAHFIYAAF
jgi:D-alanyl-lipoteichoic acid acyltransferase DltB (MBOAT superfamily)